MRRFALLVLLLSCAACARKAQPVADGGAPELPVVLPPGADGPPPVEVKPKKALDPNNFAGKSLAQWREDLRSKDRHKIIAAMKACEALGPLAVDALPDLLTADIDTPKDAGGQPDWRAADEFWNVRQRVWSEVAKGMGKAAVPHLLPLLDVPDEILKGAEGAKVGKATWALRGLSAIGPDAADAIPKMCELAGHNKSGLRDFATSGLVHVAGTDKRAVPGLLRGLKTDDRWLRGWVVKTLAAVDPEGAAEPYIATGAVDSWYNEVLPSHEFARFGPKGVAAIVARCSANGKLNTGLLSLLADFPPELLAPHTAEFVKWFDTAVKDKATDWYCGLLRAVGPRAKETIPRLLELARGGDHPALVTAAALGAPWKEVFELMRARKEGLAWSAALVLPAYGPNFKGDIAPFVELLKAGAPEKSKLAGAILRCAPERADMVDFLLNAQIEADLLTRTKGHERQNYLSHVPRSAVPALKVHLKHANPRARFFAALAILGYAPEDHDAAREMAQQLTQERGDKRKAAPERVLVPEAFEALKRAGAVGAKHLGETLKSGTDGEREWAAQALAEMGARAEPAADALRAAVAKETNPDLLGFALRALGNLSNTRKPLAEEAARKHLGAKSRWVRFCAAEALLKCEPADGALKVLVEIVKPGSDMIALKAKDHSRAELEPGLLSFGIRGEAVPLLFRLDPERAIRADAFREPWFATDKDK
jgi:hypothetical protein